VGDRFNSELEWVIPGVLLTLASAAFALIEIPDYSGMVPALLMLPMWMLAAAGMTCVMLLIATFRMMLHNEERPIAHWIGFLVENRGRLLFVTACMILTGLNMITFMWIKPLLNYLVPFWADPYLASLDHAIFGTDPWRLLWWLNNHPMAILYHRAWFALMTLTLLRVLWCPASAEKSAVMLTYFILWSVFGPVGHSLLPAAGPIFYGRLGYGDAFSGLVSARETTQLADYLWRTYSGAKFGPAAGISAMPSLHIATTVWMVIAVAIFARRWLVPMIFAASLIFMLSVSLGWHYAVDGIAGGAGAVAIWYALSVLLDRISSSERRNRLTYVDVGPSS
jgi:PAP2 superfamily protein